MGLVKATSKIPGYINTIDKFIDGLNQHAYAAYTVFSSDCFQQYNCRLQTTDADRLLAFKIILAQLGLATCETYVDLCRYLKLRNWLQQNYPLQNIPWSLYPVLEESLKHVPNDLKIMETPKINVPFSNIVLMLTVKSVNAVAKCIKKGLAYPLWFLSLLGNNG